MVTIFFIFLWHLVLSLKNEEVECDIVIVGGSLAALAAAISAATKKKKTCLIEPTDWVGGQISSSGVPAIDFAWHTLTNPATRQEFPVWKYARMRENNTPLFFDLLQKHFGNTGNCWVSINCFLPKPMLSSGIYPILSSLPTLTIYHRTVPIKVTTNSESDPSKITSLTTIYRIPKNQSFLPPLLSTSISQWYSPLPSPLFHKSLITLHAPLFIEASEFGELLALSLSPFLQALSENFDGDTSIPHNKGETCGQSIVFGFAQKMNEKPTKEKKLKYPIKHPEFYSLQGYEWQKIWTYRRLYNNAKKKKSVEKSVGGEEGFTGDISLQNWGRGNDYGYGYVFLSFEETERSVKEGRWMGGVDVDVLREAEWLAFGWHEYFRNHSLSGFRSGSAEREGEEKGKESRVVLDSSVFGTESGLVKVPYMRGSRRSLGLSKFLLNVSSISGDFWKTNRTGTKFFDRIALGCYDIDIHALCDGCTYPDYVTKVKYSVLPFYLPFRAFTNEKYENLIVAGKNMAQSFLVSAAARTHPTEFNSGTAAGVSAAFMLEKGLTSTKDVLDRIEELQNEVKKFTPIDWTVYS